MRHVLLTYLFFIASFSLKGQDLVSFVGGTDRSAAGQYEISWSVGEALTTTLNANVTAITQGVQQPTAAPSLIRITEEEPEIFVYNGIVLNGPNAQDDKLSIEFLTKQCNYSKYDLLIVNKWGERMDEISANPFPVDGKVTWTPVLAERTAEGVYYYTLRLYCGEEEQTPEKGAFYIFHYKN
ncbi:MAG: gliding motility-associated C-terminal domain-containing protein [Bacteroidota bacterium]